ncbi:hypothetical protein [Noviherbaspirillum galbum]|uniref:Uncharacterized protein n=1 Tax=Noviherbaspirillum galbum TaxID=2709383 RepID=A0A6B3SVY5_9BURK|nr:hypothetical protein [Noviherbaspirillum galbum]NEX64708.1 hypothetical protein [Noviherbaspirillum galbum]
MPQHRTPYFCKDPACGRPFQVNRFDAGMSCPAPAGTIACPHCGWTTSADPDTLYFTHAFSEEEEAILCGRPGKGRPAS